MNRDLSGGGEEAPLAHVSRQLVAENPQKITPGETARMADFQQRSPAL